MKPHNGEISLNKISIQKTTNHKQTNLKDQVPMSGIAFSRIGVASVLHELVVSIHLVLVFEVCLRFAFLVLVFLLGARPEVILNYSVNGLPSGSDLIASLNVPFPSTGDCCVRYMVHADGVHRNPFARGE